MSKYIGTPDEFKRHLRPHLSNLVKVWTKKHKKTLGVCEVCGIDAKLESAHRADNGMEDIIKRLLPSESEMASKGVDLAEFEAKFKAEHEPFERVMMALCEKCHREYDAKRKLYAKSEKTGSKNSVKTVSENDVLPIILSPNSSDEFKKRLLKAKKATITVYYRDGKVESKPWNARNFTASSNVFANLRSRPEFRSEAWRKARIAIVFVSVP